ncbi:hypothetical protein SH1V18_02550 [Vallitalea longa]|uniref:Uncharacterized protein n=1 Tax=Vallitalea longa TaxID=2936439 RepID=A0A9W5Y759_9FIRM|nr:hypothetical protein [Vallitalea longa]GKX27775.1 hypothetical protein SH1V18_02550 [Vallitalea longa]
MDYVTTKEVVNIWKTTDMMIVYHYSDRRYNSSKVKDGGNI